MERSSEGDVEKNFDSTYGNRWEYDMPCIYCSLIAERPWKGTGILLNFFIYGVSGLECTRSTIIADIDALDKRT